MQKKLLFGLLASGLLGLFGTRAQAQALLTTSPYSQDFNTLANTGTSSTLPTGWALLESGSSANTTYAADNGAANSGNTYSYGATGSTNRAFGTLLSSSNSPTIGAQFTNNTSSTITSLTVAYTGQTWRIGGTARQDKLQFGYSLDATSLSTGNWTALTGLDYTNTAVATAVTTGVSTPIQTAAVSGTISGLNLTPGQSIWLRWVDFNAAGSDDGTAIDDFSLTWTAPAPSSPDLTVSTSSLTFPSQTINTTSAAQTYQLSATNLTGDVTVAATGPFTVSKDGSTYGSSVTLTAAELASARTISVKFTPTAGGPASGSITHTSSGATTRTVALSGAGIDPNALSFDFQACTPSGSTALSDGWSQFSVTGAQTWACTTFGRDPNNAASTTAYPSGVQVNGYANNTSNENEDWLISPSLNLASTTYPLLSYWSRVAFNGPSLRLMVSTNYSGSGSPYASGVTWTDLNAAFPSLGTANWTQTQNVDLTPYKQAGVYVAFVYTSTAEEAARWTLDDVIVTNSATPPPPATSISASNLAFGYRAVGSSTTQQFSLTATNLTGNVTISSSNPAFLVSTDNSTFGSSATLTQAAASGNTLPIYVRFQPTQASQYYTGTVTLATAGTASRTVNVSGNTYDPANTLEVVNWNVEWFGSPSLGPTDDNLQDANVRSVLGALNADVFALAEVVDTMRLYNIVAAMPGYAYRVSDYATSSPNSSSSNYGGAQKMAFVYRTSVVSNPRFTAFYRTANTNDPNYNNWSSGRFPFVMTADVTLHGVTKPVTFVLLHAKANTSPTQTSYDRRKAGADSLYITLNKYYPTQNFVILGDYNDDLDQTVAAGINTTASSYATLVNDPARYTPVTLPLSQAGLKSTVSYNDIIDHVTLSNEMNAYYIGGSAEIQTQVANQIANYGSTTSDHYPVLSRYNFPTLPDLTVSSLQNVSGGTYNNVTITGTGNATLTGALSVDGQLVVQPGGVLNTNCQPITGAGSFAVAAGATLNVCDPAGLSLSGATGAVQVTGARRFSSAATYVYNGTAAQVTGSGLPTRLRNLTTANASGVTLSQPLAVRGLLAIAGSGSLTLNGQGLTLLSDADSTASVINSGSGVINGTVTVQRYVGRANAGLGYRHFSAPVANTTLADLTTSGFSPVVNSAYNSSATPGAVSPFPTVFGYDESRLNTSPATSLSAFDKGWTSPNSTSDAMTVGRGYTVNLAGGQTVDFVGTLNNGNVQLTLPRTNAADGGWHLLGNPYPSALDWSLVATPSGLNSAMYVFQSSSQYGGNYRSYANGVGNPIIALGQGFFVRTAQGSTSATLTLTNQARSATALTANAPLNRTTPETRPLVQLTLQGQGLTDDAYVYFQAGATPGFDAAMDAQKLPNPNGLDLAAVAAGSAELAINGLPLLTAPTTVPLTLRLPQAGSYTLTAAQLLNFAAGDVTLRDAQTGQQINLSQQPAYTFTATAAGSLTGRFSLQFAARVTANHQAALAAATGLYPNPARTRATLTLPAVPGARTAVVTLHNALGQVVRQLSAPQTATGTTLDVNLSGLRAGVYSLRVQLGDATVTKRLVVE